VADAQLTGERIAYHRRRLGLSQVEFAGLIGRSESWVSQVERGVRAVDRLSVLQKVADALGVPAAELRGAAAAGETAAERPEAFGALRLALTGHPAISAILGSPAKALTSARLDQLRELREQAWQMVHASRYSELAPLITSLIPELEQAIRADASAEVIEAARELLSDLYQAVAAMMAKLGETDAA
jgi:transcriptional regulator with XRE-family HTH domain